MTRRGSAIWRIALGWVLVIGGLAALVLPGPGLLMLFAGLAILSQHYEWARRRVAPVRAAAIRTAAEGVRSWWRLAVAGAGVAALVAAGALWLWQPAVPGWWPLGDAWWLPGGRATGVALVISGAAALAMIVYSFRHYRGLTAGELDELAHSTDAGRP